VRPSEPPDSPPITDPANSIENAFAMFVVAMRFYEACLNRRFEPHWFGNHWVKVYTGDTYDPSERPSITIQPEQYTHQKLSTQAMNLLYGAMGNMAAAVYEAAATDSTLRDVHKLPSKYSDTEKIIEIVYQIRNGFAHRPHSPNWRVSRARRNHYVVVTDGIRIDVDFAQLNESAISPAHFGGYEGFIAMCRHLHSAVKNASQGAA